MNKFKAVIFDLGETLIEYENVPLSWEKLYREAFSEVINCLPGITLSDDDLLITINKLKKYNTRINPRDVEISANQIFSDVVSHWGSISSETLNSIIETFFLFFQRTVKPYHDTIETLEKLKSRGVLTGILTDVPYGMPKSYVEKDVTIFRDMIDILITSVDVGFRKPNPVGRDFFTREFGLEDLEMVYVGNEKKDIEFATNAWIVSVLINRTNEPLAYGEDYQINSLSELLNLEIIA